MYAIEALVIGNLKITNNLINQDQKNYDLHDPIKMFEYEFFKNREIYKYNCIN